MSGESSRPRPGATGTTTRIGLAPKKTPNDPARAPGRVNRSMLPPSRSPDWTSQPLGWPHTTVSRLEAFTTPGAAVIDWSSNHGLYSASTPTLNVGVNARSAPIPTLALARSSVNPAISRRDPSGTGTGAAEGGLSSAADAGAPPKRRMAATTAWTARERPFWRFGTGTTREMLVRCIATTDFALQTRWRRRPNARSAAVISDTTGNADPVGAAPHPVARGPRCPHQPFCWSQPG